MKQRSNNQFMDVLRLFLLSLGSIMALLWLLFVLGDNTATVFMVGFAVLATMLLIYGWILLYKTGERQFHKGFMVGYHRTVSPIEWLFLAVILVAISVSLLWSFGLF